MTIVLKTPPGRPNRKLLAHLGDIERLHAMGHSRAAIHQALKDAGIQVALSTVSLEVAKLANSTPPAPSKVANPSPPLAPKATATPVVPPGAASTATKPPYPDVDIDAIFQNPLNRNPFLKGRLK